MKISEILEIIKDEGIARRFFVMNSFDGTLTVLGVLIAMYLFDEKNPNFIILSCIAPAVALTISGIWSAYTIERAERKRELGMIEKQMLRSLKETKIGRRLNLLVILDSLINGISPLIVSVFTISPFLFSLTKLISIKMAFYIAFTIALLILFSLGIFVGEIGSFNKLIMGLSMVIIGITIALIMYVLNEYIIVS